MKTAALHAMNISVCLGHRCVLSDLNLQFPAARWISIVGPNGAGKSTLLKALAGLIPFEGEISLFEKNLMRVPARQRAQEIAWLAQDETGALEMLTKDVVMLGRLPHQGLLGGITVQDTSACETAMQQTHTTAFANRLLGELSAGQQQRVRLARALATQAKVLLLDEPLANLDPPHQIDWLHTIRSQVGRGATVISVLHELPMALLADEMVILSQGQVHHFGSCQDGVTHRALEKAFDQRIRVIQVQNMWVALPVIAPIQ